MPKTLDLSALFMDDSIATVARRGEKVTFTLNNTGSTITLKAKGGRRREGLPGTHHRRLPGHR